VSAAGAVPAFELPSSVMKRVTVVTGGVTGTTTVEVCVVPGKGRRSFTPHTEVGSLRIKGWTGAPAVTACSLTGCAAEHVRGCARLAP
jgi:hypothetical protein